MENLKFVDTHNMVAFLSKPTESEGFEQIVDFLNAHPIKYALTINPTIYISCIEQFWSAVKAKTINGEVQLHALVDGKKIIVTESTVRRELQLEDVEGLSAKTTAWNEFSSTMASAIICLATNQKFNFFKSRVESSGDEEDLDNEMFDVNTLNGEEVFVAGQNENVVEIVNAAQVSTAATTVTITTKEITLAQALADLKSIKPKAKGIACREPGESTTTIFSQQLQNKGLSQDKGKGILVEPEKPLKKKDHLKLDKEIALKLQVEIDEEERIARAKEENIDEANIAWDDIQEKVDADLPVG
ncbi:hypothetical protein Tco_1563520 [Tanacetum coccineum]